MAREPATVAEILDDEPPEDPVYAVQMARAVVDAGWSGLCGEACPHLARTSGGDPVCDAFDEDLHPSFEAEPITDRPRAERCTWCLVAEDLFR